MQPLSREFLINRKVCCGNGCLNCPYIPKHIKGNMTQEFFSKQNIDNIPEDVFKESLIQATEKILSNKYYTPSIEDIRVGYECESTNNGRDWYKFVFQQHNFNTLDIELLNLMYKTPYLTKEQIENEGWKQTKSKYVLEKGDYTITGLGFFPDDKLRISRKNSNILNSKNLTIFYGNCPSINEFRYITENLLKIE